MKLFRRLVFQPFLTGYLALYGLSLTPDPADFWLHSWPLLVMMWVAAGRLHDSRPCAPAKPCEG